MKKINLTEHNFNLLLRFSLLCTLPALHKILASLIVDFLFKKLKLMDYPSTSNYTSALSGEIINIHEKNSKFCSIYFDVHIKLIKTGSFYKSCIYTNCRNYSNWKDLLQIGNILSNLDLIKKYGKIFINADSFPVVIRSGIPETVKINMRVSERKNFQHSLF